jgi:transcriptional regulator with XRE-family HTH domain
MITIGERLKEERNRLGLSQAKIGDIAGVTKNSQINYEANKRSPDSAYLAKIAEIGADVNYILTGIRARNQSFQGVNISSEKLDILIALDDMIDEQRQNVIKEIKAIQAKNHEIAEAINKNAREKSERAFFEDPTTSEYMYEKMRNDVSISVLENSIGIYPPLADLDEEDPD